MNAQASVAAGEAPPSRFYAGYALALLTTISFFNYVDRMVVAVLVEPIKRDLQLSDTQMGLISGLAFATFYVLLGLPLARIADKYNRVRLLSACLALWSLMTAMTGMVRSFGEMFVARMAVGIGEAGGVPTSHSLIGDIFTNERRPFAISLYQVGGGLGISVGLAIAGVIADQWGWRATMIAVGLAGLPLAFLALFTLREPRRTSSPETAGENMITAIRALVSRRAFRHLTMAIALGSFAIYGAAQWTPAFFIRSHGLSLSQVGLFSGLAGGVAAVGGGVLGGAAILRLGKRDKRWELWWPMLGYGLSGPFYLAVFASPNWQLAFAFLFLAGLSASAGVGVALGAVQSFAEPHRRATAVALVLTVGSLLGLGAGPVAVGATSDLLAPYLGIESLRYSLAIITIIILTWTGLHFWLASRIGGERPGEVAAQS